MPRWQFGSIIFAREEHLKKAKIALKSAIK